MATEQRAFAAVHKETDAIDLTSISMSEDNARFRAGEPWPSGWPSAYRAGWRIRPVTITLAEGGSRDH